MDLLEFEIKKSLFLPTFPLGAELAKQKLLLKICNVQIY
jgi:hypothetical protein